MPRPTWRQDPLSGHLYLFSNQDRRLLKALYWDKNGFCLWQKRLERDKFPWPRSEEAAREISVEQLRMLLGGIDFWNAHQSVSYRSRSLAGATGDPGGHGTVARVNDKLGALPKSTEEWQDLIRRIQEEHEEKLRGLSASLEKERAEKIE